LRRRLLRNMLRDGSADVVVSGLVLNFFPISPPRLPK
jgi:hypothetical protein